MLQARDEVESYAFSHGDKVTAELEINDYPIHCRKKVCESEFLCSITDMTNAEVKIRGTYVDAKSKVPPGGRKMFLQIIGDSRYDVTCAYKEIKRIIEEMCMAGDLYIG